MKRRRVKSTEFVRAKAALKELACKCGNVERVDADTIDVVCSICVQDLVGVAKKYAPSASAKKAKLEPGFPRSYHLYKQFVHPDGRVFEFGKENPKLKGKFPPTVIKVNTLTKFERRKLREAKEERKIKRLAKQYKKKQKEKD